MRLLGTDAETGLQEQTADYEVRDGVRKGEEEGVCQLPPPTHIPTRQPTFPRALN